MYPTEVPPSLARFEMRLTPRRHRLRGLWLMVAPPPPSPRTSCRTSCSSPAGCRVPPRRRLCRSVSTVTCRQRQTGVSPRVSYARCVGGVLVVTRCLRARRPGGQGAVGYAVRSSAMQSSQHGNGSWGFCEEALVVVAAAVGLVGKLLVGVMTHVIVDQLELGLVMVAALGMKTGERGERGERGRDELWRWTLRTKTGTVGERRGEVGTVLSSLFADEGEPTRRILLVKVLPRVSTREVVEGLRKCFVKYEEHLRVKKSSYLDEGFQCAAKN
ncbi:MAG: hypothetical protein M1827_000227 [Pycnora praestabilis]|nr:MAG: hypothetical protein M1827_000227 [Pycnora praestabilis]